MTGLYNRRGWNHLIVAEEDRCRRHGKPAVVFSIDVDDLKVVNDTEGHAGGDQLLRRCADAIRESVRTHDVAARLGGDEFAVLVVHADEEGAGALAARLEDAFDAAGVSASVGCAPRRHAGGREQAHVEADARMYEAKRIRKTIAPARTA